MRRMMRPRWPPALDAARLTPDVAEQNISPSSTSLTCVQQAALPLRADAHTNSGTRPETAGRTSGGFATLFGQCALATSTAMIDAFVIFWTFTTDRDSGPTQAAVEQGAQGTKEQPSSPRARLGILPSRRVDD